MIYNIFMRTPKLLLCLHLLFLLGLLNGQSQNITLTIRALPLGATIYVQNATTADHYGVISNVTQILTVNALPGDTIGYSAGSYTDVGIPSYTLLNSLTLPSSLVDGQTFVYAVSSNLFYNLPGVANVSLVDEFGNYDVSYGLWAGFGLGLTFWSFGWPYRLATRDKRSGYGEM